MNSSIVGSLFLSHIDSLLGAKALSVSTHSMIQVVSAVGWVITNSRNLRFFIKKCAGAPIGAFNRVYVDHHPPPMNNDQANMPVVRPPNPERAVEFYNSSEDDSSVENIAMDNINDIIGQEIALFRTGDRMTTRKFSMNRLKKEDQVDVIGWWKTKEIRSWSRLVTITATSAPSERQWSILSNIITQT
jgi:hypothetical protein